MTATATSRPVRGLLCGLLVVTALLGLAACGSDDDDGRDAGTTTPAPSGGEAGTIVAADFSLTDITVAPGSELVLDNQGAVAHTATSDDGSSFDIGPVSGGSSSSPVAAPSEPGSYPFHCEIHPGMKATLTVEG